MVVVKPILILEKVFFETIGALLGLNNNESDSWEKSKLGDDGASLAPSRLESKEIGVTRMS